MAQDSPNHEGKARLPTLAELLIAGLICGVLSCCLWPLVRDAGGPAGLPIPDRPPDEANRIHHSVGFSMVVPPNWSTHIDGSLSMAPLNPGRYARRSKALIHVSYLGRDRPSELGRLRRSTFLGREAYEEMKVVRHWTIDDGAWSEYLLILHRDEGWYRIRFGIAEERTTLPDMIRRYISTLSWDGGRTSVGPASSSSDPSRVSVPDAVATPP